MAFQADFDTFRTELLSRRRPGKVTAVFEPRVAPAIERNAEVDRFVTGHGFSPIGDSWRKVDHTEFRAALVDTLCNGLVYPSRSTTQSKFEARADWFISFFDEDGRGRYVVNFTTRSHGGRGWMPVSTSSFDAAFVALNSTHIGMLLFEEED